MPKLDTPKMAGALAIGALLFLFAINRGFKGVVVSIGS